MASAATTTTARPAAMNGRDGLKPVTTSRAGPSSRMVVKFLELMCKRHIEAINFRDFYDLSSGLCVDKAVNWKAEVPHLSDSAMDLPQYVKAWQSVSRQFPNFGISCTDMSTTLDETAGSAETVAKVESIGMPAGVVRKDTVRTAYKLVDGKWLATRFTTVSGAR